MGSRQRRREAARSSGNREAAAGAPPDPAVEMPFCDQPSTSGQASAASGSPPYLLDLMDEDWGAAVINMEEIEETLGLALTTTPSPSQPSELSRPELEILPNGIPVDDLAEFLRDKGDHSLTHQAEMVRQKFNCSAEDLPRLQLAVEINRAARHNLAFDLLDVLTETVQRDPTGTLAISTIASELCMVAAARR